LIGAQDAQSKRKRNEQVLLKVLHAGFRNVLERP
jgi:hypothetical protein